MKLVRIFAAATAAVAAAVAFQTASPSATAAAGTDCGICWPPGIVQR